MIFVTVGNATQGFRRLLDAVDRLAAGGNEFGPIFVQAGHNDGFQPMYCQAVAFLSTEEFQKYMERAELIISHGGCGTLLHAVRLGKVPVAMPRKRKYGEHVNDHQVQLVEAFAARRWVVPAYEPVDLPVAIVQARTRGRRPDPLPPSRMVELVGQAIDELTRNRGVAER